MTTRKKSPKKTAFVPRFLFATAVAGAGVIPLCVSACSGQIQGQGTGANFDVPDAIGGDVAAPAVPVGSDVAIVAFGGDVAIVAFDSGDVAEDVAIVAFDGGSVADSGFRVDGDAAVNPLEWAVADAAFEVGGDVAVDAVGGGHG